MPRLRSDLLDPLDNPSLEDALGSLRRGTDGQVYHPDGETLVRDDDKFTKFVHEAKEKRTRTRYTLWRRIGPLRYGEITIKDKTEIWNDERQEWWKAHAINIAEDGEPCVRFRVKGTEPTEYVECWGSDIADLVEDGTLRSKAEVNREAEELLESLGSTGGDA
ncbi:hypothetical protein [Natrinema thermotolerans]